MEDCQLEAIAKGVTILGVFFTPVLYLLMQRIKEGVSKSLNRDSPKENPLKSN